MSPAQLAGKIMATKNVVGAVLLIGGVLVSAMGMLKVPSQQAAIAATLDEHNKTMKDGTAETNRNLRVLICLQAKLDTPIKCVARGVEH